MSKSRMHLSVGNSDDEPFQWGNNDRGGCGAPLRDKGGVPIANLRKVTRDSKSPDKRDGYWNDKNGGNHSKSFQDDNEDSDSCRVDRGRRFSDNGTAKNKDRDCNVHNRRNDSSSNYSPQYSQNGYGGNSDNRVSSPSGSLTSPKKFMGAIKHMNSSMGDKERESKLRKEQEYQQQLRDQIEEKKRKKEQEKRGENKVKQKELQEYLRGQYKGDIPQHTRGSVPDDDDNSDGDRDYGRHRDRDRDREHSPRETRSSKGTFPQESRSSRSDSNSNRINNDNGSVKDRNADARTGKQDRRDRGDDDDNNSRKWDDRKSTKSSPKRRQTEGRREDYNDNSDTDRGSNECSKENGHSKGNERRGGSHKHQDKEGRWVSDAEYVELTTLCDRLMSQQDRLQEEIQHQAELIKDLQRKPGASTIRTKGGEKGTAPSQGQGLTRSKSVQHTRTLGSSKEPTVGMGREQPKRPSSTDARGDRHKDRDTGGGGSITKEQQRKASPKVAFGGSAVTVPKNVLSKAGGDSMGPVPVPGYGVAKSTAGKKPTAQLAFGGRAPSVTVDRRVKAEQEVPIGRSRGSSLGVVKGPVIVSYDDEDGHISSKSNGNGSGNGNGTRRTVDPKRYAGRGYGNSNGSSVSGRDRDNELNGESEYLRMDAASDDVMSGDQLDRLLVQAKRVRAAPH